MRFVKMHGIGNDYVYIDAFSAPALEDRFAGEPGAALVRGMSDRHAGIGSDGVILVCRPRLPDAHARMRMFNADGSEAEMCGNGIRCVAKFAHDRLGVRAQPMLIETARGRLSIAYRTHAGRLVEASVDMGEPAFDLASIPADRAHVHDVAAGALVIRVGDETLRAYTVSMGNPHAVIETPDPAAVDLRTLGPRVERHPAFPARVNVHVARWHAPGEVTMRTWERGAGETLACGTGACAVVAAGAHYLRKSRRATAHLPGGSLGIDWNPQTNHITMTGPAEETFEGEWPG